MDMNTLVQDCMAVVGECNITLTNSFSINMLNGSSSLRFERVSIAQVQELLGEATTVESAIGHADTATVVGGLLGRDVPANRVTLELGYMTIMVVAQYKGPRLPEGSTMLPEGATIEWWLVLGGDYA